MRYILKSLVAMLLIFCLVLSAVLPAVAAEGVKAVDILQPVNPNATPEARSLYAYLQGLTDTEQFVVGQFDISEGGTSETWNNVIDQYGMTPGMYSVRYVLRPEQNMTFTNVAAANAAMLQHYNEGAILLTHVDGFSMHAHLVSEALRLGYYTDSPNMVLELDSTNPDRHMDLYALYDAFVTHVIEGLTALEASGVKAYMFRYLVEHNYHDFYGVDETGYAATARVMQQFTQRFLDSDLNGWLMTYSPGGSTDTLRSYAGNEWVDVLGVTCYGDGGVDGTPISTQFENYEWFCRSGKPFGLTEISCASGDNYWNDIRVSWYNTLRAMMERWPRISFALCWDSGNFSLQDHDKSGAAEKVGQDDGKIFLASPFSLTLDKLPDYRNNQIESPGVVQLYSKKHFGSEPISLEQRVYNAADLKAMGLDINDLASFRIWQGFALKLYSGKDATGDMWGYAASMTDATDLTGGRAIGSLEVVTVENVALGQTEIYASDNDDMAWKANDGADGRWEGKGETGWLYIQLDKAYTISRYVVKHASTAGMQAVYNTADYRLQYSLDGENWKTVDTVTGNTMGQNSREVYSFTAPYVRLMIDKANGKDTGDTDSLTIAEWELYGIDGGLAGVSVQPEDNDDTDSAVDSKPREDAESDTSAEESAPADEEDSRPESDNGEDSKPTSKEEDNSQSEDVVPDYTEDESDTDGAEEDDGADTSDTEEDDTSGNKKKPVRVVTTETYFPWWAWVLIGAGMIAAAVIILLVIKKTKKKE